jgi:hypothetical protein
MASRPCRQTIRNDRLNKSRIMVATIIRPIGLFSSPIFRQSYFVITQLQYNAFFNYYWSLFSPESCWLL